MDLWLNKIDIINRTFAIFPYMQVYSKGTVNYIDFIKPQVHTAPTSKCRLFVLDTALQPSVREEVE